MPISGDLVKQGAGGASMPMRVPTFQLIIIKTTSQRRLLGEHLSRFSEQSEEENIIKAIRGSPRERAVSKMGPAAHWLRTHQKEKRQQFPKKSLRVQVVRGLIFQEFFSARPPPSGPRPYPSPRCRQPFAPSHSSPRSKGMIFWKPARGEERQAQAAGCL